MINTEIDAVVAEKMDSLKQLGDDGYVEAIANVAICLYFKSLSSWRRWSDWDEKVRTCIGGVLVFASGNRKAPDALQAAAALRAFDVEEGDSPDWVFAVELMDLLIRFFEGDDHGHQ